MSGNQEAHTLQGWEYVTSDNMPRKLIPRPKDMDTVVSINEEVVTKKYFGLVRDVKNVTTLRKAFWCIPVGSIPSIELWSLIDSKGYIRDTMDANEVPKDWIAYENQRCCCGQFHSEKVECDYCHKTKAYILGWYPSDQKHFCSKHRGEIYVKHQTLMTTKYRVLT
jgi:hypothetical protein